MSILKIKLNSYVTFELLTVLSDLISSNESKASVLEVNRVFIVNWSLQIISPSGRIFHCESDKGLPTAILKNRKLDSKRSIDDSAIVDGVFDGIWKG